MTQKTVELNIVSVRDIQAMDGVSRFSTVYLLPRPPLPPNVIYALSRKGAHMDANGRFPIRDVFSIRSVLSEFGWTTVNDPPYTVWTALVDHESRQRLSLEQVEASIGPELWAKLRPFQQTAVHFFAERKCMFLGDAMGAGKTLEALASISVVRQSWPVLIVCPKSLLYNWKNEIETWLGLELRVMVVRKPGDLLAKRPPRRELVIRHDFAIMSYGTICNESVQAWIKTRKYNCAIIDETQYIKNISSQRTRVTLSILSTIPFRILASGTPFSYPKDMFSQIKGVRPSIYPFYFDYRTGQDRPERKHFVNRYCRPEKQFFGNRVEWSMNGYERQEELHAVLETLMIRRRKEDILSQLPAKLRTTVVLEPLLESQVKEIKALLAPPKVSEPEATASPANPFVYTEAFRLTCQYKIPRVVEFLRERLIDDFLEDSANSALVFFHHQPMKDAIVELLVESKLPYFVIDGSTSSEHRAQYQKEFQAGGYRVGLLSILAAGAGLTLTKATLEIFCEVLFGPEMLQAEDRAHRIGQTRDVLIEYLLVPDTTDIVNFNLVRKKDRESSRILDGSEAVKSMQVTSSAKRKETDASSSLAKTIRVALPSHLFNSR
jgi:SWI/SNF-related matrix-associated actin-dependent regulator 1 of chromatin subfamily A